MKELDQKYEFLARQLSCENTVEDDEKWEGVKNKNKELGEKKRLLRDFWDLYFPAKKEQSKQRIINSVLSGISSQQLVKSPRMALWYGAVAMLVVALSVAMFWGIYQYNQSVDLIQYVAKADEVKSIVLPDGTEVDLNSGSSLIIQDNFNSKKRQVVLMGEGYFNVAKNEDKPFEITTTHMTVSVLGTQFNLKAYPEDRKIEATLDEGKIQLDGEFSEKSSVYLKPGQQAILNKQNGDLQIKDHTSTLTTQWKNGQLIFYNNSLEEIVSTLERKYRIRIIILDEEVKGYRFSGDFSNIELKELMKYLKAARPFNYNMNNEYVVITK